MASPTKKVKGDAPMESTALSPDQKSKVEENRRKAQFVRKNRELPHVLHPSIGPSWFTALEPVFKKPAFATLDKFIQVQRQSRTIFPPHDQVWSWTHHFDITETKVVILGQDPYHGPKQAHGLCFSVQRGVSLPPSLLNVFKELETDIPGFQRPGHGDLSGWAKQGVLLLNACLTVPQGQANAHKDKGWEMVTDATIQYISDHCNGVVFLLWGAFAQKKAAKVNGTKHHLLKSVHPSPLSAHRGFLGCRHFSQCNAYLVQRGQNPINWGDLD
eukprot:snap_masked-scaffold703_size109190-processed-gene-0.15 protein:Tk04147 transcript:snap_masked-scaffold703_size109190-processed-gene-0.15-mRNA-1 annotation:"hypothetical protein CAPTEDRAFT_219606"